MQLKGIPVPLSVADLEPHRAELAGAWDSMLGHQLPALPPVQQFWDALPEFFVWLKTGFAPPVPGAYRFEDGETALRGRTLPLRLRQSTRTQLEIIRFAAANLLCVDLLYGDEVRASRPIRSGRPKTATLCCTRSTPGNRGIAPTAWIESSAPPSRMKPSLHAMRWS